MDYDGFIARCTEVRELIESMKDPLVVSHYDADGLSSAGLTLRALKLRGINGRSLVLKKLSREEILKLKDEKEIIFTDLGGGAITQIDELLSSSKVAIIDHHQTPGGKALQANPELFGFSGSFELSAAGCAYFVFRNPELIELGIVGAVGDMQFPLKGLNRIMLEEGAKTGKVEVANDLCLFGRMSRSLAWFLQYCTEPFIPGITGKKANCALLLEELGIPLKDSSGNWRKYYQLTKEEKIKFVSALAAILASKDSDPQLIRSLVGEVYTFPQEKEGTELSDAKEYSTVLNACGRHKEPQVGLGVCLGDETAKARAGELLILHRRQLREAVEFGAKNAEDFGPYYLLDGREINDEEIIGVVAGMLYSGAISRTKPILAISLSEENKTKVSSRATKQLVDAGLNLSKMMKEASVGIGVGGGHSIAAGANIHGDINEFLLRCGRFIGC